MIFEGKYGLKFIDISVIGFPFEKKNKKKKGFHEMAISHYLDYIFSLVTIAQTWEF